MMEKFAPHSVIEHNKEMMKASEHDLRKCAPVGEIKGIELGFANLAYVFIPFKYIIAVDIEGITSTIRINNVIDEVMVGNECSSFKIAIDNRMAGYRYKGFDAYKSETIFDRIIEQADIDRVSIMFKDGTVNTYYPVYKEHCPHSSRNIHQRIKYNEEFGDLEIEISEIDGEVPVFTCKVCD